MCVLLDVTGRAVSSVLLWLLLPATVLAMKLPQEVRADRFVPQAVVAGSAAGTGQGLAQGESETRRTEQPPPASGVPERTSSESGSFRDGKKEGHWVEGGCDGVHGFHSEGTYVAGKRHGHWVEIFGGTSREGEYVNGLRQGRWVERDYGDVSEGPYVDGARHGHWVTRNDNGNVERQGRYVRGKRHGYWIERWGWQSRVREGPYFEGEQHGHWIERGYDGSVAEGLYVEGERHGRWVKHYRDGYVEEGSYVDGREANDWTIRREPERNEYVDSPVAGGDPLLPEMVLVPAGSFRMGCVSGIDCGDYDEPVREVTIASFALSKYEVTIDEYDRFTDATGRKRVHRRDSREAAGRHPVTDVSWYDAVAYVEWLSARTGESYRLPSEAEWEYAARAGTETVYSWGNDIGSNRANCPGCDMTGYDRTTTPVGSFEANPWKLHDMHGNVYEWTLDCKRFAHRDGYCAPLSRVVRGGSYEQPTIARSAARYWRGVDTRASDVGFRVARTVVP